MPACICPRTLCIAKGWGRRWWCVVIVVSKEWVPLDIILLFALLLVDPRVHSKEVVQGAGRIDHQSLLPVAYLRGCSQYPETTLRDTKNALDDVAELSVP
jgi:hypothetical protein